MSAGHKETPRDTTCQTGTVVFSSNPLMSDVESDWSPIHDAAFNGRVLTLQKLITQGICVNLNTLDRVSPLHGACVQGHEACVKLLMENGADVNGSTVDGKTPLTEACARGHMTCVSLLLQHGATPVGTSHSSSPIHRAAAKGHPECIAPLVQHGADVDQYIEQSGSPLHVACSNQHPSTVRKLLQLGAGVNNSVSGDSPLHIAARLSHPELVSLLLDHGADRSLRNPEGQRPLDLAPPNSLAERLLRQAGEVSPLMQMCRLNIRRAVGKRRLGGIHDLQLPTELKHYLLYH
ncbi:ankyrin repeat and SOCS box protein 9-like isoform X1 [Paralichthys olivaceus]|uniref:ankyrin repeat and SOCS box protein 9-like isoform X1 n=1 Tax=Paralichthys olivaceus TaxID=8255 RepID=UPI00097D0C8D|nr:PREDICTED: ankyrin repeat and SOCS box protein 9-like isoform X1 [Paralichthys olivaceus]